VICLLAAPHKSLTMIRTLEITPKTESMDAFKVRLLKSTSVATAAELMCCPGKPYHDRHITTINMIPDNVLLEIFDLCQKHDPHRLVWKWHVLAHVCHRWRQIVFASPTRLNLQILCTHGRPVRKNLDIWPTLPLVIRYEGYEYPTDEDDIIAALEHPSRVCDVRLHITGPQLGRIATVLQEPFPTLTHLLLWSNDSDTPVLPVEFLARSAPCLQAIILTSIPFPTLPLLLPSTVNLVTLELRHIPQTGYISPEAMVTGLATLTRLTSLYIQFQSPASRPNRIRPPAAIRTVLPALASLYFSGVREYLEDFVARIDAPRLDAIWIYYFNQLIDFEVPKLSRFIDHPESLKRPMRCIIEFLAHRVSFRAGASTFIPESLNGFHYHIEVCIVCEGLDWQNSHLTQALSQISVVRSNIIHFAVDFDPEIPESEIIDNIEWSRLLSLFSSVRTMFVPKRFAGHVARALEDTAGAIATELLPALDMLCLKGEAVSSVEKFIAVRRDSGRPVTFINTETEFEGRLKSYQ
jgi:hypothetical protein